MTSPESIADTLHSAELALLDQAVRSARARLEALLADDFVEFGASGKVWTRDQIIGFLTVEAPTQIVMQDFQCALLADDVALVTYRALRTDAASEIQISSLRSSVWKKTPDGWRLRFHQGTRAP